MKRIVISSAHGKHVGGAEGLISEVRESRRVVATVADCLQQAGIEVSIFHDDVSKNQAANLRAVVDYHNAQKRDLDVSIHFNAHIRTDAPRGVEVLYVSSGMAALAGKVSLAIADVSGLLNRGIKYRNNLAFLVKTTKPAILIEVCFVDSAADVKLYRTHFNAICIAIAETISGKTIKGSQT